MNQNNFDSQRPSEDTSERNSYENYHVYSKEYTPGADGYTEQSGNASKGAGRPPRRNSAIIAVIAVLTVAALLLCALSAVGAAMLVAGRYTERIEVYEQQLAERNEESEEIEDSETETEKGPEVVFSPEEDTTIERSDSPAVTVGGKVGDDDLTVADVAALVADSVVEITTSETSYNGIAYDSGAGSGVIVTEGGIILTNNHVVEGATDIAVRLTNGNVYQALLVATDSDTDIAILKIQAEESLTVAKYGDSDKLVVGQEVVAIGNPLGVLGGTVTNGIISALEREVTVDGQTMTLLQHNAAISPGNSGGALFNMRGELVGIVNAKSSSSGAEGLGFAIPMNTVIEVYEDLVEFGYVKGRADHGLIFTTDRYYLFQSYIYIYSSRYTDELRYGDRLLAIGGKTPTSIDSAYALLDQYEIGDTVEIVVARNGQQVTATLTIVEYTPQA